MQFKSLLFLLPAAVSAAVLPRQLNIFTLSTPENGEVSWLGGGIQAVGGPLGWWNDDTTHTALKLFIQFNADTGIAFDSTATRRTVYMKPAENGLKEVVLGSPWLEQNPDEVQETGWAVVEEDGKKWFTYTDEPLDSWVVCDTQDGKQLYFGQAVVTSGDCTGPFRLQVTYA